MLAQLITFAIAVLGAVLGIINTWNSLDQRRVRLIVRPCHAFNLSGPLGISIDVVNLSGFAVTINEIGIILDKSRTATPMRIRARPELVTNGSGLPQKLEPRQSLTALVPIEDLVQNEGPLVGAFATTACGVHKRATSPALQQFSQQLATS